MTKDESIYNGFCEICPSSKEEVTVQVEDGNDELGDYVIVHWNNMKSSKYYYK